MNYERSAQTRFVPKKLKQAFAITALSLAGVGCVSISQVNADLFENGNDLDNRYEQLAKGMTMEEFVSVMGPNVVNRWQEIDNPTKAAVKCGCEVSVTSVDEMEEAAASVARLDGYQIGYKAVQKDPDYLGTKKKVDTKGYNVIMRFVFEDGQLEAWDRDGGPVNERKVSPYFDFNGVDIKPDIP